MPKPKSPLLLVKAEATTDDEGLFTPLGIDVLTRYSDAWLAGTRDLELERQYPDLVGSFYDVRSDSDYARRWASEPAMQKALTLDEALVKAGLAAPAPKLVMAKFSPFKW